MKDIIKQTIIIFFLVILLIFSSSISIGIESKSLKGFDKGPSTMPVIPLKKSTMVNFDSNLFIDDYAYLASIPSSVFLDNNILYSNPLIYYQDSYSKDEDKYLTLNSKPGIDYFMEDWMGYCNQNQDQMTLINIPEEKLDPSWKAKEFIYINGTDPYEIASKIALNDWSYSEDIVVAPAEEKEERKFQRYSGKIEGTIPAEYKVEQRFLELQEPEIGIGGSYKSFKIKPPAKFIVANLYWENLLFDYDFQLYDKKLGMAGANSKWNVLYDKADGIPNEPIGTYIYNYGDWEVGVTYMPTQSSAPKGKMQSMYQNVVDETGFFSNFLKKNTMLPIDLYLYPGIEKDIPEKIPYGCRDVEFTLKWNDNNLRLGFFILDPTGIETFSSPDADAIIEGIEPGKTERTIKLKGLGETSCHENYRICVFTMDDLGSSIDFEIEYSWQQNITREKGDILASASEGAILASQLNAPLLYVKSDEVPKTTQDIIYKLGVKNIHYINLNNCVKSEVKNKLKEIINVIEYSSYKAIYDAIRVKTGSNDVVFSTVDPWSYFYGGELKPAGEEPGCLFIGPASYIAAHHGVPLLIVDNHPVLSQTTIWHTQFWIETSAFLNRPKIPKVSCMVLTGRRVIEFLEKYGYNLPLDKENLGSMITVAGQYDIGFPWDRTFTGRLIPGRFCFSPVDTAYQISRNIFYPALIFENPAMQGNIELINGSSSTIKPYIGKLIHPRGTDLVITKDSQKEQYEYPILHTYNVYQYKFNEIAPKAWGGKYTTANGITPGETPSNYPIDMGVVQGKVAAYYPDLHDSEVTPIYAAKAGYSNCFSSNFEACIKNLNKGVIMWMESCHGHESNYGGLSMWNPDSPYVYEPNPWRAYDRVFAGIRNWKELGKYISQGLGIFSYIPPALRLMLGTFLKIVGIIPNILFPDVACTENPDAESTNSYIAGIPAIGTYLFDSFNFAPAKDKPLSRLLQWIPILGRAFRVYGDGIVVMASTAGEDVLKTYNGLDFDKNLDNLHNMGLNTVSCLIAGTYLHQSFVRHGCSYLILDPWTTSWYSAVWFQNIPRQLALGDTIGQAYEKGMEMAGAEYLVDNWWWDLNENVLFFGDPDLRVYTPSTYYSDANYWTQSDVKPIDYDKDLDINGHMPFGAENYPNEKSPTLINLGWILILIIFSLVVLLVIFISRKKKNNKK
jgi:hypothetical protein